MLTIAPEHCAVLAVDMQNDFCHHDGHYGRAGADISGLLAAVGPVSRLITKARAAGAAVAYTRLVYDEAAGLMEDRHAIKPRHWLPSGQRLRPQSWGAAIVDQLTPAENDIVVDKPGYSAFDATDLEKRLRQRNIKTLIVCGVVSYACVLATSFAAFDRGFDVLVAKDATGAWSDDLAAATSQIVDLLLGHSVSINEIEFSSNVV